MSAPVSAPPASPPVVAQSGNDFQSTFVDLFAQLVAAVLAVAENVRMGPVPGGVPFDKTTLSYKDYNLETSITHKEYIGYEIAGNHPAGLIDPQWAGGFPLWPIFVSAGGVSGGTGSALAPIRQAISGIPQTQLQGLLADLPGLLAPALAKYPGAAALLPALMPILQGLLSNVPGPAAPPAGP